MSGTFKNPFDEKAERPISVSAVKKYERCPYSFFLQYRKGVPDETGPAAKLGLAVHKALDYAFVQFKSGLPFGLQELITVVYSDLTKSGVSHGLAQNMLFEADQMLRGFDFRGMFSAKVAASEVRIDFERRPNSDLKPYPVTFVVDFLTESEPGAPTRKALVWDYKSDRDVDESKHRFQLSAYRAFLAVSRGFECIGAALYFLRHRQVVPVQITPIDEVWRRLDGVVSLIRAEKWSPSASSENCNSPWPCGHRHVCEYYCRR